MLKHRSWCAQCAQYAQYSGVKAKVRGFTLVELMVTVALLAVLTTFALPEMRTYMLNSSIRSTARNFVADVMAARAEAIRTNEPVFFTLTSDEGIFSTSGGASLPNVNDEGPHWAAVVKPAAGSAGASRLLLATRNKTPGSEVHIHKKQGKAQFAFDGLGKTNVPDWIVFQFTRDEHNRACQLDNKAIRCLQIEISPGGSVHLCEPGRKNDSRACKK